jgi:ribosomal protein S16
MTKPARMSGWDTVTHSKTAYFVVNAKAQRRKDCESFKKIGQYGPMATVETNCAATAYIPPAGLT